MHDWFQMALYKRVLVNFTKRIKMHPFCGASYSINIWNQDKKIIPLHPEPIQKYSGIYIYFQKTPILKEKHAPLFCQFLGFGSNPKIFISLYISICFASFWYTTK